MVGRETHGERGWWGDAGDVEKGRLGERVTGREEGEVENKNA